MESAYATITIGGTLRRADIDRFVAVLVEDYCVSSYSGEAGEDGIHEDISRAHNEKQAIAFEGEDVPYAEFNGLEGLCRELGLAYRRNSDPIFDSGTQIVFWKPGMDAPDTYDATDGEPVLFVRKIREAINHGTLAELLDSYDEIIKFPFPLVLEGSMADEPTPVDPVS